MDREQFNDHEYEFEAIVGSLGGLFSTIEDVTDNNKRRWIELRTSGFPIKSGSLTVRSQDWHGSDLLVQVAHIELGPEGLRRLAADATAIANILDPPKEQGDTGQ
jgi:hypothetical protein